VNPRLITGVGVVSPVGIGRQAFFEAMRTGARAEGRGPIASFDVSAYPHAKVAEVPGFDAAKYLGEKGLRTLDRLSKLLVVAARLALHDIGLKKDGAWIPVPEGTTPWSERTGIVVSNAYASLEAISELDRIAILEDARYINPSRFPLTVSNTAAGYASIWEELRALNVSVSDGNCGALDAVACADALLEGERADLLLVGGAEAMSEALFVAFDRLHAFGTRGRRNPDSEGSLPWQRSPKGGFGGEARLGEGAVLFALETEKGAHVRAQAQGMAAPATLATICGYGASFEPPPRAESLFYAAPDALERAIQSALDDAGVAAGEVDAVISGISGIRAFDTAELTAIDRAIGASAFVSAPKLAHGETLGAGGALAILTAIAHMRGDGGAYGVRGALRGPVRTVVVTALGYYGNAAALVMRRPAS
jgi:3-oxoacyl-[acyl-carrier-protein] synthase II